MDHNKNRDQKPFISTNESLLDIAMTAAKTAMQNSGMKPEDLDLIICSTIQGDNITPALSCEIQHELGASCPAFDVNAACTGFIYRKLQVKVKHFFSVKCYLDIL
jgi:3-oxoacyl-[acyl-carrier-protein] synthase-3